MKERHIDSQMLIRKIKKLLYKKIIWQNNLIPLGDLKMTLGNKDRSTGSKCFCESQEELMRLIREFDVEDHPWRRQNSNAAYIYTLMAGVILLPHWYGLRKY